MSVYSQTHSVCESERYDTKKAKEAIEVILLSEPNNVTCMLQLANIFLKQGHISRGFEILVDAYSMAPHAVQGSSVAAVLPFALKVSSLKKQAIKTNDPQMWNKLGDGYFEMGIFNEATAMYKNSLDADEKQHEIRLKLSLSMQKNCQTYSALEELQKIVQDEKNNLYANYYLGKILMYDVKNVNKARYYFAEAKMSLIAQKDEIEYVKYTNLLSDITKELGE